jgi:hypothetical protein
MLIELDGIEPVVEIHHDSHRPRKDSREDFNGLLVG